MKFYMKKTAAAVLIGMLGFCLTGAFGLSPSEAHHRAHRDYWEDCPSSEYGHPMHGAERTHNSHNPRDSYCR